EIHLTKNEPAPIPSWMGWSNGRWDGDTLVVDVTGLIGEMLGGEQHWLDRAGNFSTDRLHVVERYTMVSPNNMMYEATLEDPSIYTRPWKISMPLYRRLDKNVQLLEFKCAEYVEELKWGHLRLRVDSSK